MPPRRKRRELHAGARCWQRYGVRYTADLRREIVSRIRKATKQHTKYTKGRLHVNQLKPMEASYLRSHSGDDGKRRETWLVTVDGIEFRVVYCQRNRVLVTFLPPRRTPELSHGRQ